MPELIFYRRDQEVIRYPVLQKVRLGRHPDNDLTLPDEAVSRFHCTIEPKDGSYWLTDQSRNGTFVNGRKIQTASLKDRDEIQIGPWKVRFVDQKEWADRETAVEKKKAVPFCGMVGRSRVMQELFALIQRLAPLKTPVLIMGETGTGKELVARALHELSSQGRYPFVAVNCGAISPQLIESELFGHERGAFTGAVDRHAGAFEQARGGVLFLDEVGELPLDLQPKLLRVLEDQTFRRVGGREEIKADARLVAATHRNLQQQVQAGKFREDLFYRLFTVPIRIPPLRERTEDLPPLLDYFLFQLHPQGDRKFSEAAREKLMRHGWKGNIRELKNTVLRGLLLSDGPWLEEDAIQFPSLEPEEKKSLDSLERGAILAALREHQWNKKKTAEALGIAKSTLFQKIKEYGIKD